MTRWNKWPWPKYLLYALPFLLGLAWVLRLPFSIPAAVLPERVYRGLADRDGGEERPSHTQGAAEVFEIAEGGLHSPGSTPGTALPTLDAVVRDLRAGLPPLRRARLVTDFPLAAEEYRQLDREARQAGIPLTIEAPSPDSGPTRDRPSPPLTSLSWRRRAGAASLPFELQFPPGARAASSLAVAAGSREIWKGRGSDLPPDLVLRLEAGRPELARGLSLDMASSGSGSRHFTYSLGAGLEEDPRILVIRDPGRGASWVEATWPCAVVSPSEAASVDLLRWELIVLDGLSLTSIQGRLLQGLLGVSEGGTGSLLFTADSPDFGREGESPELEALLPVSLKPTTVRDLPDLGLLLLIDTSGSMFGDKLSLAKVTGLELLAQLKPEDRVGLLLFSDQRSWVYDFLPNRSIKAAPAVEPVPAQGGTDLAAALKEGLGRLEALPLRERHVVIVSDGVTKPADFPGLAARARAGRISISTMGVGQDADRGLLERLATLTGGHFYPVASSDEIPSLLFQDRKSLARPPFVETRETIYAINGAAVGEVTGMALLAPRKESTVLLSDSLGDALLSSRETGNRAVLVFASDLHGTYTKGLLSKTEGAGIFKDRLQALLTEEPLEVSLLQGGRGTWVRLDSSRLVAPRLLLTAEGEVPRTVTLEPQGPGRWGGRLILPLGKTWNAGIQDRGLTLGSFGFHTNQDLSGLGAEDAAAATAYRPLGGRRYPGGEPWLILAFFAGLCVTVAQRFTR